MTFIKTLCCLGWLAVSVIASDEKSVTVDPAYGAMMAAEPDRHMRVENLELTRDVFTYHFKSGDLYLMPPVMGREWGALFEGEGTLTIDPQVDRERFMLGMVSDEGQPAQFEFKRLYLFFSDQTANDLLKAGTPQPANGEGAGLVKRCRKAETKVFGNNFRFRILRDFYNDRKPERGVQIALLEGGRFSDALAVIDPLSVEESIGMRTSANQQAVLFAADNTASGLWYMDRLYTHAAADYRGDAPLDALHYDITTKVDRKRIEGTTILRFTPLREGVRYLPIDLMSRLVVNEAVLSTSDGGETIACTLAQEIQEGAWDSQGNVGTAVIADKALDPAQTYELKLSYTGDDVVFEDGNRHYFVAARTLWYPNFGTFGDRATFDLTFRYPKKLELLSVGNLIDSREEGKEKVDRWQSEEPLTVAGFNFGEFNRYQDDDEISGLAMEVASFKNTNPEPSQAVMADNLNSARLFTTYFGPLPYNKIRISQQAAWSFGQAWPTLVFMPTFSFDPQEVQRYQSLVQGGSLSSFVATVGSHELAHQWWGHLVTAESISDQWIEEGFAQFSAMLFLQHTQGWNRAREGWEDHRESITQVFPGTKIHAYESGAISLGLRLSNSRTPGGYQRIVYEKGAFVVHMLRMMMMDHRSKEPDAAFIAMMKDFTDSHGGGTVNTQDFKTVVERHMTPAMNANGDGTMDWFFDQWVHGTHVPVYTNNIGIQSLGEGMYGLKGTVSQSGVPADFKAMAPLYAVFDDGRFIKLTDLPFKGDFTHNIQTKLRLPAKPDRIVVNFNHDILSREAD